VLVRPTTLLLVAGGSVGVFLRLWQLDSLGFNSDEAVYGGQGASIAGVGDLTPYFPIFRAHPLLFQTIVSVGYHFGTGDLFARLLSAAFGFGTVVLVFLLGRLLYGRRAGRDRRRLLCVDAVRRGRQPAGPPRWPGDVCATLTLYLLAQSCISRRPRWVRAAAGAMGLAVLSKETMILTVGAVYVFFALSPEVAPRVRTLASAGVVMFAIVAIYPLTIRLAGHSQAGQQYLGVPALSPAQPQWSFYPATVPVAIGLGVLAAAVAGLWLLRRENAWPETLLLTWIVIPASSSSSIRSRASIPAGNGTGLRRSRRAHARALAAARAPARRPPARVCVAAPAAGDGDRRLTRDVDVASDPAG